MAYLQKQWHLIGHQLISLLEKVLPGCPEKHFIFDEAPTAEKRVKYSETIPASIKKMSVVHTLIQMNGNTAAAKLGEEICFQ